MEHIQVLFADLILKANDIHAPTSAANDSALKSALATAYVWAGIICVLMVIIGGVRYTVSNGDSSGIQSAKNTILYALAGLVIVLAAAGITQLILGKF